MPELDEEAADVATMAAAEEEVLETAMVTRVVGAGATMEVLEVVGTGAMYTEEVLGAT